MTAAEVEALFREYTELAWNQKDDAAFERMVASEIEVAGFSPRGEATASREDLRAGRALYFQMFPDLHIDVDRVVVDGLEFFAWLTCRGTAQPEAFGWDGPASEVVFDACVWARVADGRIVTGKNLIDFGAIREGLTGMSRMDF